MEADDPFDTVSTEQLTSWGALTPITPITLQMGDRPLYISPMNFERARGAEKMQLAGSDRNAA